MRVTSVKSLLWFVAIMLLVLAFPIQVYVRSPYVAMVPYLPVALILLLTWFSPSKRRSSAIGRRQYRNIPRLVGVYALLVSLNTAWQTAFGVITPVEGGAALFIFLVPVLFYGYFRSRAAEREVRWVLVAIAVAGLVVGMYFAYDSYVKLALHQVNDYAILAEEYSATRAGGVLELSSARVSTGYRSSGLLESHSVSGAWVVLGTLAALALVPLHRPVLRRAVVLVFGTLLLLGLNFTSILAFAVIMVLFEFEGLSLLRGRLSARLLINLVTLALTVAVLVGAAFWLAGSVMSQFIVTQVSGQTELALGTGGASKTMVGLLLDYAGNYLHNIRNHPASFLLGDGYSVYGMEKGGDIGAIETLARFGLPFFVAALVGFLRLVSDAFRQVNGARRGRGGGEGPLARAGMLQFAAGVALLVLITEGHYTVWTAKSVVPVVFLMLAIFERYLPVPGDLAASRDPP